MNRIALTFDDGPSRWTEPVLDVLAEHGARATFFVIGRFAETHPELVRRIAAEGHEVGNHTWSHPRLARDCDDGQVEAELQRTNDLLTSILGTAPHRFRAPYHDVDERVVAVAAKLGLEQTGASVAIPDWHPTARAPLVAAMVLQRAVPGAVVGLHDGVPPDELDRATRDVTAAAVAAFVPTLLDRGFACVTVSELLSGADR